MAPAVDTKVRIAFIVGIFGNLSMSLITSYQDFLKYIFMEESKSIVSAIWFLDNFIFEWIIGDNTIHRDMSNDGIVLGLFWTLL